MSTRYRLVAPSGHVYFADWDRDTSPTDEDLKQLASTLGEFEGGGSPIAPVAPATSTAPQPPKTEAPKPVNPANPPPAPAGANPLASFLDPPTGPAYKTPASPVAGLSQPSALDQLRTAVENAPKPSAAQLKEFKRHQAQQEKQDRWNATFDLQAVQRAFHSGQRQVPTKAGGQWSTWDAAQRYVNAFGKPIGGDRNASEDPVWTATGYGQVDDAASQAISGMDDHGGKKPFQTLRGKTALETNPVLRRAGQLGLNDLPGQVLAGVIRQMGVTDEDAQEIVSKNGVGGLNAAWNYGRYFLPGGVGGLFGAVDGATLAGNVADQGPSAIGDAIGGLLDQNNPAEGFRHGIGEGIGRTLNLGLSLWGLAHGRAALGRAIEERWPQAPRTSPPAIAKWMGSFHGDPAVQDPHAAAVEEILSGAGAGKAMESAEAAAAAHTTPIAPADPAPTAAPEEPTPTAKGRRKRAKKSAPDPGAAGSIDVAADSSPAVATPGVIAEGSPSSGEAGVAQTSPLHPPSPPPEAEPVHRNLAAAMTDDELATHKAVMDAADAGGVKDPANDPLHQAINDELEARRARQDPLTGGENTPKDANPRETGVQSPETASPSSGPKVGDEKIVTHGNGQKSRATVTEVLEDGTVKLENRKRSFEIPPEEVDSRLAEPKSKARPKKETPANPHEDVLAAPVRTMTEHELAEHYTELKRRIADHASRGEEAPVDLRQELSRVAKEAKRRSSRQIKVGGILTKVREGLDLNAVEEQLNAQHSRLSDLERRAAEGGPNAESWARMAEAQRRALRIVRKSAERKLPEQLQARLAEYLREAGHDDGGVQAATGAFAPPQDLPHGETGVQAAVQTAAGGRVAPDPIAGGTPKDPNEIQIEYGRTVGTTRTGQPEAPRALGTYNPTNQNTVVRYRGDLSTVAHELGHRLDDTFGLVGRWMGRRIRSPFDNELLRSELQHTAPRHYSLARRRLEGVAEFVRAYLINPAEARRLAPNFYAHFEQTVSAEMLAELRRMGDDIRTWAGASSEQKIAAAHHFSFDDAGGALARARRFVTNLFAGFESDGYSRRGWQLVIKRNFLDAGAFLHQAVNDVLRLRGLDILPEVDPRILTRQVDYLRGKVEDILAHGPIDFRGNRVGGGLMHIFEPLDQSSHGAFLEDLRAMLTLGTTQRALEKGALMGDYSDLLNAGGGFYRDETVLRDALRDLQADPDRFARISEGARRYREFADQILRYAVEGGRLHWSEYQAIRTQNQWYSAMQRIVGDEAGDVPRPTRPPGRPGGGRLARFQGSRRSIRDPLASLLDTTMKIVESTDRNHVLQSLNDLLVSGRRMHDGAPLDLSWFGRRVGSRTAGAIVVYNRGVPEHWAYEPGLHRTIQGMPKGVRENFVTGITQVARILPRLLQATVTHSPGYFIRNLERDTAHRLMMSDTGSGLRHMIGAPTADELAKLRQHGGSITRQEYLSGGDMEAAVRRAIDLAVGPRRGGILALPGDLWHRYETALGNGEIRNRVAEYRSAFDRARRQLGYDEHNAAIYAADRARDLMDFARGGAIVKAINQWVPFFNAQFQGLDKLARGVRADPRRAMSQLVLRSAMPALAAYLINRAQGDDAIEEYSHLPSYQRDAFYNFRMAPGLWLRVAKPFELGVVGTGFERLLDRAMGNEHAFDGWDDSLQKAFLSQDEAASALAHGGPLRPFVEIADNQDFFRGSSIIPDYEANKALDLRDESRASNAGKLLGRIFNTDSRYVDHFLQSAAADYGRVITQLSDLPSGKLPTTASALNDVTGSFTAEPAGGDPDVLWIRRMSRLSGGGDPLRVYRKRVQQASDQAERIAANRDLRQAAATIRKRAEDMAEGLRGTDRLKALAAALK